MTDAHHYAVRRVFNARHLANLAALDGPPRSRAYACGEQAALAERATAFNALAAYHRKPNPAAARRSSWRWRGGWTGSSPQEPRPARRPGSTT